MASAFQMWKVSSQCEVVPASRSGFSLIGSHPITARFCGVLKVSQALSVGGLTAPTPDAVGWGDTLALLWMRKLGFREAKQLTPGHTARKWLNLGPADTEASVFPLLPNTTHVYTVIMYVFSPFLNHDKEPPWCREFPSLELFSLLYFKHSITHK